MQALAPVGLTARKDIQEGDGRYGRELYTNEAAYYGISAHGGGAESTGRLPKLWLRGLFGVFQGI